MNEGLRERKKRATRDAISQVATALFYAHGFDNVTVDDVAQAAGVSKMTVFNYFPRKEDLMFDKEPEGVLLLRRVLAGRGQKSALKVLRDEVRRLVETNQVFTKFDRGVLGFWDVVEASPALRARLRELADESRIALAAHFEGPNGDLVASLVVAGWRAAYRAGLNAARHGKSPRKAASELERVLDATMAAARAALRSAGFHLMPVTDKDVPGGVVHELPADLRDTLVASAEALAAWRDITPLARNEFICWVLDAKQEATRKRRIQRTKEELEECQRRPCCWPGCKHRERTGR